MAQLHVLTGNRHDLAAYRTGQECEQIPDDELEPYVEELDGATGDLDALDEALTDVTDTYGPNEAVIDRDAALAVHQHLDISRRHASHQGLWHWLCIVKFPEFVRYRWSVDGAIEEKFLGGGTDLYSNALHRLWWFAELTRDGSDYSRTARLLDEGNQYLVNRIFDRSFARNETAVKAAVDVLLEEAPGTAERVVKEFRHRETNYTIESMSKRDIETVLEDLLVEVGQTASAD